MLQTAVVVMTVLGCGDHGASCDFVTEPPKTWETKVACESAIPETLLNVQSANYPVITASCDERIMVKQAGLAQENTSVAPAITPSTLPADEPQTGEKPSLFKLKDGYALVQEGATDTLTKIGETAGRGYRKLEGAVKITFENISEKANLATNRLRDGFNLQN